MSVDTLRRAAVDIRQHWSAGDPVGDALLSLADWLDWQARLEGQRAPWQRHNITFTRALNAARAYLGEPE